MAYYIGDEEVNGIIIGGEFIKWQLCYLEKPVMTQAEAENEEEAMQRAKALKARLQDEGKATGRYQEDKFTVRFYD